MENNNEKQALSPEEKERIKEIKRQEKERKSQESAEKKRVATEKKARKKEAKRKRHEEGKYYFWEFNRIHYSKTKILEVNVFFWTTLIFGIFAFLVPVVALSSVTNFWKSILFVWPALIIFYAIINRFMESVLSNSKNRNTSLFFQRFIGIGYVIILFSYFIFLIAILTTGASNSTELAGDILNTPAIIEVRALVIIPIIISLVLATLKAIGISWYGTTKEGRNWDNFKTFSRKHNHNNNQEILQQQNTQNEEHYTEEWM